MIMIIKVSLLDVEDTPAHNYIRCCQQKPHRIEKQSDVGYKLKSSNPEKLPLLLFNLSQSVSNCFLYQALTFSSYPICITGGSFLLQRGRCSFPYSFSYVNIPKHNLAQKVLPIFRGSSFCFLITTSATLKKMQNKTKF